MTTKLEELKADRLAADAHDTAVAYAAAYAALNAAYATLDALDAAKLKKMKETTNEPPEILWVEPDGDDLIIHNDDPDLEQLIFTGCLHKYTLETEETTNDIRSK